MANLLENLSKPKTYLNLILFVTVSLLSFSSNFPAQAIPANLEPPCEIDPTNYVEAITSENIQNLSCSQIRFRIEIIKENMRTLKAELQKIKSREDPYNALPSARLIEFYGKVIAKIRELAKELKVIYRYNQLTKVLTPIEVKQKVKQISEILKSLNIN